MMPLESHKAELKALIEQYEGQIKVINDETKEKDERIERLRE